MLRYGWKTLLILGLVLCVMLDCPCRACQAERVLVVTSGESPPVMYARECGSYVVSDLVAAGLPFDVATYSRFVPMSLADYDVIVLNGHTSPVPVADVAAKCQAAIGEGRKVFINGSYPYRRYNTNGTLAETLNYSYALFGATCSGRPYLVGKPVLPRAIEKDPSITAVSLNAWIDTWQFATPPPITMTVANGIFGFLCPSGGAVDGSTDNLMCLLDYGKVVSYLRNGYPTVVGFANDRIDGKPIAAFEVHCDRTKNLVAIDALNAMSQDLGMPLSNLLVYANIDSAAAAKWNNLNNPLMRIGSHSRTHPQSWPPVPNVLYETSEAIAAQKAVIPATIDYFNFSGSMDPTAAQMDQIRAAGVSFGGKGADIRSYKGTSGAYINLQRMPTERLWMGNLAKCTATPFCPSLTLCNDYNAYLNQWNFADEIKTQFQQNVKYGLYSYTYIHDYGMDPSQNYYVNGTHMSVLIRSAMDYLHSQNVVFLSADQLVARLQDYIAGSIACTTNPDGSLTVAVTRPGALANGLKIGWKGDLAPGASGDSVLSQQLIAEYLYVTLRPEVNSTVDITWTSSAPRAPVITTTTTHVSPDTTITWEQPIHASGVVDYKYGVGTTPGGTDIRGWTVVGNTTSTTLGNGAFTHGATCYVSVRARYAESGWGPAGISAPFIVDITGPGISVTDDGIVQKENDRLNAIWTADDPESGVVEAMYAAGTAPGLSDVVGWTPAVGGEIHLTGLHLQMGGVYYITVKAKNATGTWSEASSNGIRVAIPDTIGFALKNPDEVELLLTHVIVTAIFPDVSYIEDADRAAGIGIVGLPPEIKENDELTVTGELHTNDMVRTWQAEECTVTGSYPLKPVYVSNRYLGGAGTALRPGPKNGLGANNVGLLVTSSGKVTEMGDGYVRIDDGSIACSDSGECQVKAQVAGLPPTLKVGSYVLATGISSLEKVGDDFRRLLLTRRQSDLVVVLP